MPRRRSTALTRESIYQRVWSQPLTIVAKEVGLTGNALAKICDRLLVPYPPRGYWAKQSVGKAPDRPPLPPAPEGDGRVTIGGNASIAGPFIGWAVPKLGLPPPFAPLRRPNALMALLCPV